jgi:hypothetical protein
LHFVCEAIRWQRPPLRQSLFGQLTRGWGTGMGFSVSQCVPM